MGRSLCLGTYPFSERLGWLEDKFGLSWQVMSAGGTPVSQRLTPVLLFVGEECGKTEEAINSYVSVFKDAPNGASHGASAADILSRYGKGEESEKEGTVRYAHLSLLGLGFGAMDSAREHKFAFNETISFIVPCDTQEAIDYLLGKSWRIRRPNSAAGSRTSTAYPGRSLLRS